VRCPAVASLEEEHLKDSFSGVDLRRQWCSVANLDGDVTLPARLQRCNVYDDTAASVSALTNTDGHQISRNAEVLDRVPEGVTVRRNDDRFVVRYNDPCHTARIKVLRID